MSTLTGHHHDASAEPATTDPAGTPDGPAASTAPGTAADLVADIVAGRARIDELDAAIVALVRQRVDVSHGIQRARMAGGGRRVEHGREVQVVNRYASALGAPGTDLALALLTLCRGSALPGA